MVDVCVCAPLSKFQSFSDSFFSQIRERVLPQHINVGPKMRFKHRQQLLGRTSLDLCQQGRHHVISFLFGDIMVPNIE